MKIYSQIQLDNLAAKLIEEAGEPVRLRYSLLMAELKRRLHRDQEQLVQQYYAGTTASLDQYISLTQSNIVRYRKLCNRRRKEVGRAVEAKISLLKT